MPRTPKPRHAASRPIRVSKEPVPGWLPVFRFTSLAGNTKKTYQCGQGEVDTCKQYDACKQTDNQCDKSVNGQCIKWNKKFTCELETCSETTLICGEQSYCLDGECFAPTGTTNNEFNQAASALAALGEAAKGLGDPPKIFTGKPMECSKKSPRLQQLLQGRRLGRRYRAGQVRCRGKGTRQGQGKKTDHRPG